MTAKMDAALELPCFLHDLAEALGHCRDDEPLALSTADALELVRDLRLERDEYREMAEKAQR